MGAVYGGPAFVGDNWHGAAAVELEGGAGAWRFALGGTLHGDTNGFLEAETDETYDLGRLIHYIRHDATPTVPIYGRMGPIKRLSLGRGHLVKNFNTTVAWDERTLGAEIAYGNPFFSIGGFTSDLRMGRVVGGFAELQPAANSSVRGLNSLVLGAGIVHDRSTFLADAPTAFQLEAAVDIAEYFEFAVSPFVSYARFLNYGSGFGGGVDLGTDNLINAARTNLRLGLFVSQDGFAPGFFGPHYAVANDINRIVTADSFFDEEEGLELLGTSLADVTSGVDFVTELEVIVFSSFEASAYFRRHWGDQMLSSGAFRIASRPRFLDGLRIELSMERTGLGSFFSAFGDLKDRNSLLFEIDYPLSGGAHLSLRSRYGYRKLESEVNDPVGERFLVQRRFEPLVGVRYRF